MASPVHTLVRQYVLAFREEPKLRAYAAAALVDDVGVAVAAWASMLLMTNLFTSQRARASLMLPTLLCFLIGTIVSGPLADWGGRLELARLARWRWRLVIWARLVETSMLGVLLISLASGPPTLGRVLPFAMLTAFTKTAFRPARGAFAVDLLRRESPQVDAAGETLVDERGEPLRYKTHLLALTSLVGALAALATLSGLLLGGRILALTSGRYWPLFLVQGLAHLGFVAILFFHCHPTRTWREVKLGELLPDRDPGEAAGAPSDAIPARVQGLSAWGVLAHFGRSLGEGARFLLRAKQRPLLILLAGAAMVELVTESYDGKMIVKHVLHGSDESLRHAELAWSVVGVLGVAAVPALARAVGSIGRIFLLTMLLDGVAIVLAGRVAAAGAPGAVLPFTIVLAVDHSLTLASTSLTELAQNSASSAAMRGRIAGTYAFVVIVGDLLVEGIATEVSESIGIPAMLARVGLLQIGLVALLAVVGGRRLWRFGLHEGDGARGAAPAGERAEGADP